MILLNYNVAMVTRAEWGARTPKATASNLNVSLVTSHWEGPHMGDFPHSSCASKVRGIQNYHMDAKDWNDIAYNLLACPHGYVFEGRGYGKRSAANGYDTANKSAYAICYLSGEGDPFTEDGKRAMKAGGDYLTFAGSPRNAHRDWKSTECPGDDIYAWTHAGQPITIFPTPTPVTGYREDFDMPDLVKTAEKPEVYLVIGNERTWMNTDQATADVKKIYGSALRTGANGAPQVWPTWRVEILKPLRPVDNRYPVNPGYPTE